MDIAYLSIPKEGSSSVQKALKKIFFFVDLSKKMEPKPLIVDPVEEVYRALVLGVHDYFNKSGFSKACLGLSGGVDSALVACVAVDALGKENVLGVLMPWRFVGRQCDGCSAAGK